MGYRSYSQAALSDRMLRAARLESELYEEVERDLSATSQALTVVLIVAVATGIGNALGQILAGRAGAAVGTLIVGIVFAVIGWAVWSGLSYIIGTRLFGGVATYGECLRTIGFANSPGVLNVLSFIPGLGVLISFAVGIWMLVATIIAMRQALDITTGKAVLTAIIGFFAYIILTAVVISPFVALFARV